MSRSNSRATRPSGWSGIWTAPTTRPRTRTSTSSASKVQATGDFVLGFLRQLDQSDVQQLARGADDEMSETGGGGRGQKEPSIGVDLDAVAVRFQQELARFEADHPPPKPSTPAVSSASSTARPCTGCSSGPAATPSTSAEARGAHLTDVDGTGIRGLRPGRHRRHVRPRQPGGGRRHRRPTPARRDHDAADRGLASGWGRSLPAASACRSGR